MLLTEAIRFAAAAHDGQMRKATHIPYIVHPVECVVIVSQMTDDEEMLAAAALHDTVEDCGVSLDVLREKFGPRVAHFVAIESEDKSKTWQERKQATIDGLDHHSTEEKILVLADKLSNIRSISRDYAHQGEQLWQRFHEKHREKIGWYYRSVGEKLAELADYPEYQEYMSLVKKIFGGTDHEE